MVNIFHHGSTEGTEKKLFKLYMTTELIAHAGRGGFETRPYRPALTGMPAINMRIF